VESIAAGIRDATEEIEKDGMSNDVQIRLAWAEKRHGPALARLSGLDRVLIDDRNAVNAIRQGMLDVFPDAIVSMLTSCSKRPGRPRADLREQRT